jgi:predicted phosphate transport protein (TIGR00153 family)
MVKWLNNYISSRRVYFELFCETSANLVEMSELLGLVLKIQPFDKRKAIFDQINSLKEKGDNLTYKIALRLNEYSYTPISRTDIQSLSSAIDDVADNIQESTRRMYLYHVEEYFPSMAEIARIVIEATAEIKSLVLFLNKKYEIETMFSSCRKIKHLEHQADKIYYKAIADLFSDEKDPVVLLKYNDILHSLETAVNKCKSVAEVIESIVVKGI